MSRVNKNLPPFSLENNKPPPFAVHRNSDEKEIFTNKKIDKNSGKKNIFIKKEEKMANIKKPD